LGVEGAARSRTVTPLLAADTTPTPPAGRRLSAGASVRMVLQEQQAKQKEELESAFEPSTLDSQQPRDTIETLSDPTADRDPFEPELQPPRMLELKTSRRGSLASARDRADGLQVPPSTTVGAGARRASLPAAQEKKKAAPVVAAAAAAATTTRSRKATGKKPVEANQAVTRVAAVKKPAAAGRGKEVPRDKSTARKAAALEPKQQGRLLFGPLQEELHLSVQCQAHIRSQTHPPVH
jgi:hypothetical protein